MAGARRWKRKTADDGAGSRLQAAKKVENQPWLCGNRLPDDLQLTIVAYAVYEDLSSATSLRLVCKEAKRLISTAWTKLYPKWPFHRLPVPLSLEWAHRGVSSSTRSPWTAVVQPAKPDEEDNGSSKPSDADSDLPAEIKCEPAEDDNFLLVADLEKGALIDFLRALQCMTILSSDGEMMAMTLAGDRLTFAAADSVKVALCQLAFDLHGKISFDSRDQQPTSFATVIDEKIPHHPAFPAVVKADFGRYRLGPLAGRWNLGLCTAKDETISSDKKEQQEKRQKLRDENGIARSSANAKQKEETGGSFYLSAVLASQRPTVCCRMIMLMRNKIPLDFHRGRLILSAQSLKLYFVGPCGGTTVWDLKFHCWSVITSKNILCRALINFKRNNGHWILKSKEEVRQFCKFLLGNQQDPLVAFHIENNVLTVNLKPSSSWRPQSDARMCLRSSSTTSLASSPSSCGGGRSDGKKHCSGSYLKKYVDFACRLLAGQSSSSLQEVESVELYFDADGPFVLCSFAPWGVFCYSTVVLGEPQEQPGTNKPPESEPKS